MEDAWAVAVGCVVGLLIIGFLNAFPGEPFDYDKGEALPSSLCTARDENSKCMAFRNARIQEVDIAASQLKVQKLQELLGLEKDEVQKMIHQAKTDAINGRQPSAPVNYARWLDIVFYTTIAALMVIVLRTEYSVDVVQLLASMFPREAETVQKIAATIPTQLVGWWQ
jgi:hypothetical protein